MTANAAAAAVGRFMGDILRSDEAAHLVVADLLEVLVVEADGVKRLGRREADNPIDDRAQSGARAGSGDGDPNDDRAGASRADGRRGSPHRRTGSEPVVDENYEPAGELRIRTRVAVGRFAPAQLTDLAVNHRVQRCSIDPEPMDELLVEDARAVAGERAHRELLMPRYAQFTDDVDVERHAEPACNLIADRN